MIRLLTKKDDKHLYRIIKSASLEKMFIVKKKNNFFGYFIENKLVGVVGFYVLEEEKMIGFISAYTIPEHRRQGIYDKLTKTRLNYCKENYKGYSIYVTTNDKSKNELEKLGFIVIEPQYRMKLEL